jgi:hypothetical protein
VIPEGISRNQTIEHRTKPLSGKAGGFILAAMGRCFFVILLTGNDAA